MTLSNLAESLDRYTYADYLAWDDKVRYELIYGEAYMMSSPSTWHQDMSISLGSQLWNFFQGKPCRPYTAPIDVRLFPQKDNTDNTVVQPDLLVVCDTSKIAAEGIIGAPDFIIEILSPGTKMCELNVKWDLYLKAGVREYWIVGKESVIKLVNVNGNWDEFVLYIKDTESREPVTIFDGCVLKLSAA